MDAIGLIKGTNRLIKKECQLFYLTVIIEKN